MSHVFLFDKILADFLKLAEMMNWVDSWKSGAAWSKPVPWEDEKWREIRDKGHISRSSSG